VALAPSTWDRKGLGLAVTETGEGIVRLSGEGETTSLFGDTYVVKAAGEETSGVLAVIEADLAPHSGGTPLHIKTLEDESYYVVAGTLTFRLGERTFDAPPGSFVHIPKGVVHTHWNATTAPVRLLGFPSPAGFELFFADLAELMASMPPGPPDMSRVAAVYEKYGLRVVGPPPSQAGES
jgi:quercetin dioxygenase-like cupin family protein